MTQQDNSLVPCKNWESQNIINNNLVCWHNKTIIMHHSIDTRQIIMHTVIAFHQDKYLLFLVCVYIYCSVLRTVGHFLKLFRPMFMVVLTLLRPHYSPYSRELKGKEPRSLDNGLGEFVCRAKFWHQVQVTRRSLQLQKVSHPFDTRFDA